MNTQNSIDNTLNSILNETSVNHEAIVSLLDQYGLNWNVNKQRLMIDVNGENVTTQFFGLVREDKGICFNTCKDSYEIMQNSELAEVVLRIAGKLGFETSNCGMFSQGAKVYFQLQTGAVKNFAQNNDTINKYITAIGTHDCSGSNRWGAVSFPISCGNTFAEAYRQLANKARHTKSMKEVVEASLRTIELLQAAEAKTFEKFYKMSEIPVIADDLRAVVRQITEVDLKLKETLTLEELKQKYSTQSINQTDDLLNSIQMQMNEKGATRWGLFSGVTHYTQHVMSAPKRDNGRLESKFVGSAFKIDNEAFALLSNF